MLSMLIAYDAAGNVVQTNDYMVAKDESGQVIGLIDFSAHEAAGGKLRDIWDVGGAAGSATWPEWIGARAHDFRVELQGKRVTALIHKTSGHRRERAALEEQIAATPLGPGGTRDIRHLVGGPNRPLILDDQGRTVGRSPAPSGTPRHLPVLGMQPKGRNR